MRGERERGTHGGYRWRVAEVAAGWSFSTRRVSCEKGTRMVVTGKSGAEGERVREGWDGASQQGGLAVKERE